MIIWYLLSCNQNSRSHDMGEFPSSIFGPCQDLLWQLFLRWHVEHSVCICLMPNMTHLPSKIWDSLCSSKQLFHSKYLAGYSQHHLISAFKSHYQESPPPVFVAHLMDTRHYSGLYTLCRVTSSTPYCKWDAEDRQVCSFAQHYTTRNWKSQRVWLQSHTLYDAWCVGIFIESLIWEVRKIHSNTLNHQKQEP